MRKLKICSFFIMAVSLAGCPKGTMQNHYRPPGHQNTTIDVAPSGDAILFNAFGNGGSDLYMLYLDDMIVVQITDSPAYEVAPSFSSDGKQIVYAAGEPDDRADHIFTIGVDGESPVQLTNMDANDTAPRFSPDGSQIVFARDKSYNWGGLEGNWDNGGVICVMNTDGTGEVQLTADELFAHTPSFTPDGKSVIYFANDGQFSIPANGSASAIRIGPPVDWASFSNDGKRLLFSDGRYSSDYEIFVSDSAGSNRKQITDSKYGCYNGVFDRTGEKIYFLVEEWPQGPTGLPKSSIWSVDHDGKNQHQISDLLLFDDPTQWKPRKPHEH